MSKIEHGTLGNVEYRSVTGNWHFLNRTQNAAGIISLGEPSVLLPAPVTGDDAGKGTHKRGRKALTRDLSEKHREFIPAVHQIIDLYEEAAVVGEMSRWGGSRTGPFLAVAYASSTADLLGGFHPPRKTVVHVGGASGDKISIMDINFQRFRGEEMILRRPGFKSQSQPIFSCDGPVEQIEPLRENETSKAKPYLAIRTQRSITIIQLTYEVRQMSGESVFAAKVISNISTQMNGRRNMLHFTVNPWKAGQIAIVDTSGQWSVWNIPLKSSHRSTIVQTIPTLDARGYMKDQNLAIGWANITWDTTIRHLLVATRKQFLQIEIKTGLSIDKSNSIVGIAEDVNIVGLGRAQNDTDCIMLLTNYALHILNTTSGMEFAPIWRHYRHPSDKSLCYAAWKQGQDFCFFIFSRHNPNISVLRVLHKAKSFDLFLLRTKESEQPILSLMILEGSTETKSQDSLSRYPDIFSILTIHTKFDIRKQDYTSNSKVDVELFKRAKKPDRAPLSSEIIDSDDEILDSEGGGEDDLGIGPNFEKLTIGQTVVQGARTSILNLGRVYEEVFQKSNAKAREGTHKMKDQLESIFNEDLAFAVQELMERPHPGFFSLRHLSDQGNVFANFSGFGNILPTQMLTNMSSKIATVDLRESVTGNNTSPITLKSKTGIFDQTHEENENHDEGLQKYLTEVWLNSLPVDAPARIRRAREGLIQMISTDIHLSSFGGYPQLVQAEELSQPSSLATIPTGSQDTPDDVQVPTLEFSNATTTTAGLSYGSQALIPRLFLENFTPVTHTSPGNSDLVTLLDDWNVKESPEIYQWRPLENIQQMAYEDQQRSRSRSKTRTGSRRRRAVSANKTDKTQDITTSERVSMTQPIVASSSQVTSSQRLPASQIQRGKFGDSRKTKKRRTEGF